MITGLHWVIKVDYVIDLSSCLLSLLLRSQLQRDLRDAEHRAREGQPSTRSASVSSNGTSSKRKSGSFLSSLFSSGDNNS